MRVHIIWLHIVGIFFVLILEMEDKKFAVLSQVKKCICVTRAVFVSYTCFRIESD